MKRKTKPKVQSRADEIREEIALIRKMKAASVDQQGYDEMLRRRHDELFQEMEWERIASARRSRE